jgi:hypothetical protein
MKYVICILLACCACLALGQSDTKSIQASERAFQTYEYATIRWEGRDRTHLVRPNGQVEFLGPLLAQAGRPNKSNERAVLMTIAINAVAREGYEVAAMTDNTIVLRRALGH